MRTSATGRHLNPPWNGEGDRTKCGGGVASAARPCGLDPSARLRLVSLPVPGRISGFTLVELLVVLAIIGLMSAAVILAIPDPRGSLAAEAERLAARAKAAQTRAILDSHSIALRVSPAGYAFERRERAGWQPLADKPFAGQAWTEGTTAAGPNRILFDPTGLTEPAALTLQREDDRITVEFAQDGTIRVRA